MQRSKVNAAAKSPLPDRRYRALYVIGNMDLGGAQRHLLSLLRSFRDVSEILMVYGDGGPALEDIDRLGVAHQQLRCLGREGGFFSILRAVSTLRAIIHSFQPDVIHAHSSKAGLIARIAGHRSAVPVVFTVHGWGFKPGVPLARRWIIWFCEAYCVWLTKKLIVVSNYDYQLAYRWLPGARRRMILIRNGIPDGMVGPLPRNKVPVVIMVARFREPKRQDLLLKAFLKASIKAEVWFIGNGPELANFNLLLHEAGAPSDVKLLGERADVDALLAKSDVFVLLSDYEGMPLSILEAMRARLPVVASNVGGIPEQVVDGVTGYLVSNKTSYITTALQKLMLDSALRERMGTEGRARFVSHFCEESMIAHTALVYRDAVASK